MDRPTPTRTDLLALTQQVAIALRGLDLLEGKREALLREFVALVDRAASARDTLRQGMQAACNALTLARATAGDEALRSAGLAARRDLGVELVERNVWGVRLPELRHPPAARAPDARGWPVAGSPPAIDEAAARFEAVLDQVLQDVAVECRLKRLGAEIRKTMRRIHALSERVLPVARAHMRTIARTLEEREREDRFRTKRFKGRREGGAG